MLKLEILLEKKKISTLGVPNLSLSSNLRDDGQTGNFLLSKVTVMCPFIQESESRTINKPSVGRHRQSCLRGGWGLLRLSDLAGKDRKSFNKTEILRKCRVWSKWRHNFAPWDTHSWVPLYGKTGPRLQPQLVCTCNIDLCASNMRTYSYSWLVLSLQCCRFHLHNKMLCERRWGLIKGFYHSF